MPDKKPDHRPPWKVMFDTFEHTVGPRLEQVTRSREFARIAATTTRAQRALKSIGVPAALVSPNDLASRVQAQAEWSILTVRNGIKPLPHRDGPPVAQTPRDAVWCRDRATVYRYRSDQRAHRPPVLLVMSLISKAYIFDLRPGSSFVEVLLGHGLDVFMLDWGIPDARDAQNTLQTYCDEYLPEAVSATCAAAGVDDLTMLGYCFGGTLALLYAAGHPDAPVRNFAFVATPIDFNKLGPMSTLLAEGRLDADDLLDETGNVPAESITNGFRMLKPLGDLATYADLLHNLWDDDFIDSYQAIFGWARDQIPFPGATMRQVVRMFVRDNAIIEDRVRLTRPVSLRAIHVPVLCVLSEQDHITPPDAVGPLLDLVGSCDTTELRFRAGHVGLIVGRTAVRHNMPAMAEWIVARSGDRAE
jgi:polyhydroxyalkanoate synthase subunit PhaC